MKFQSINRTVFLQLVFFLLGISAIPYMSSAQSVPFSVKENLFDQSNTNTLGLDYVSGVETVTVFSPTDDTDKFSNGVVMAAFKGSLYCMWQSSATDEDAADTWVAYSRSDDDGKTWSAPMVLAETLDDGYCSSGGWIATSDTLVGFINTWPSGLSPKGGYTRYVKSSDGLNWSEPAEVKMKNGSRLEAVFEQDPHVLANGRIVNAAHFQPGLLVCPIYTDDPLGITGWEKGRFSHTGSGDQSRELEPSLYQRKDGTIVMVFRDQNSTYYKLASESKDNGETWSHSVLTNMPDARTKQSAGNLPDGTSYLVGNPVTDKTRIPLAITLSTDGVFFDKAYLIREGGLSMPALRYEGKAKRLGYHYPKSMVDGDFLYVAYALNKEDVQYTRIPLNSVSLPASVTDIDAGRRVIGVVNGILYVDCETEIVKNIEVYNISGACCLTHSYARSSCECDLSDLRRGLYVVKVTTDSAIHTSMILLE